MKRIRLHGVVGWDIVPALLVGMLDELDGEDVELHIASPGGYVDDALAIVTAIRAYSGKTRAIVAGLAASAASWIALSCDEVVMGPSSLLMIHGPWTWTQGDADQLRADASVLDKYAGIMRRAYARHGYEGDDLLVGGDHWFDAEEALAAKLITGVLDEDPTEDEDEVDARAQVLATLMHSRRREVPDYDLPQEIAARLRGFATRDDQETDVKIKKRGRLAPLAVTTEEVEQIIEDLEGVVDGAEEGEDIPVEEVEQVVDDVTSMDDDEEEDENAPTPAALIRRERNRVATINQLGDRGYITRAQRSHMIRRGVSANQARAVAIELSAKKQTRVTAIRGGDATEKRRQGMVNAIVARGIGAPREAGNEWNGRTLLSMAAACHPDLARQYDGAMLIEAVLNRSHGQRYQASADGGITHGNSDFVNVLGDSVNRTMLIGYNEIEDTFAAWTNRAELKDFRLTPRLDLGAFAELEEVPELGEIPSQTLKDRGVNAQLKKYGGKFGISMEALVNDDLRVFTELPRKQGQAAKKTVANHVYRILTSNPTIEGDTLFSATHGTTGSETLSAAGLGARRAAMRRQTMPTGGDADTDQPALIMPRVLLVPPELYGYALEFVSALLAEGGGTNVWAGSLQIVEEPRLTNSAHWFLAASGTEADTVEVAYLMGRDQPILQQSDGWTVEGTEFKVLLPFAVTLRDYRGLQRGTGGAPA